MYSNECICITLVVTVYIKLYTLPVLCSCDWYYIKAFGTFLPGTRYVAKHSIVIESWRYMSKHTLWSDHVCVLSVVRHSVRRAISRSISDCIQMNHHSSAMFVVGRKHYIFIALEDKFQIYRCNHWVSGWLLSVMIIHICDSVNFRI